MTAYLSRNVRFGYTPKPGSKKKLQQRRDLDLLLNDWGIHHFHLSTTTDPDGFMTRSDHLLLVKFRRSDAYMIDIILHGQWAGEHIVRTTISNWPDAGLIVKLEGILGLRQTYTDGERKQLRNVGIVSPIEIDGAVYVTPTGLSTAGTSLELRCQFRNYGASLLNARIRLV